MLVANNLIYPITLVFKINQINVNCQEVIDQMEDGTF